MSSEDKRSAGFGSQTHDYSHSGNVSPPGSEGQVMQVQQHQPILPRQFLNLSNQAHSNEESKVAAKPSNNFTFVNNLDLDDDSMEISMVIDEDRKSHRKEIKQNLGLQSNLLSN